MLPTQQRHNISSRQGPPFCRLTSPIARTIVLDLILSLVAPTTIPQPLGDLASSIPGFGIVVRTVPILVRILRVSMDDVLDVSKIDVPTVQLR